MVTCILCNRLMEHRNVKPIWVFDLERETLIGKAHATCVRKSKLHYDLYKEATGEPPTQAQIKFAAKLHRIRCRAQGRPSTHSVAWYAYLLTTNAMYTTSNVEELLATDRTKSLLDWWQNGSKIITAEKAEQIQQYLRTRLEIEK